MATPGPQQLTEILNHIGHTPVALDGGANGRALILPFGGRVLGLFGQEENTNFLWCHPHLNHLSRAQELLEGPDWPNTGGDRTWIAPEVDTQIEDLSDPWGSYTTPPSIDPGQYTVKEDQGEEDEGVVTLHNRAEIPIHRRHTHCRIDLMKRVSMAPNPLRHEATFTTGVKSVQYAGYELETRLALISTPDPEVEVGIWNILVLPAGGTVLVPTFHRTRVRDIVEPTGTERLHVDDRGVRFLIDGKKRHKISIRALALTGRAGYIRREPNTQWSLVVRNFQINPSGEYVDVPWDDPADKGYAFQAYSDDGRLGDFGEIEYHTPAIRGGNGAPAYTDRSQVWAFRGAETEIRRIGEQLLGQNVMRSAR